MAGPVKGEWAGEDIVLNDAATETTLLAILDAMKRLDKNQGGTGDTKDAAKKVKELATNSKEAAESVEDLGKSSEGAVNTIKNAFGDITGAAKGLSEELLFGGDSLSDFSGHITGLVGTLPVLGDAVGGVSQLFVSVIDNQIGVFRSLSTTGINLGESLFGAQLAATKAGLPLDVFGQVVANNSETLSKFGGSASEGARRFTEISGIVQRDFGPRLSALGMTMEETAQFTADYMELQTTLGRDQKRNSRAEATGVNNYINQLDELSKMTGQQRDQIADQLQQQAADTKFKAKLATMDGEAAERVQGFAVQLQSRSPEIAEAFREMVATGGVPMTEFAQNLAITNPELVEAARAASQGALSNREFNAAMRATAERSQERFKQEGRSIAAIQASGNAMFDGMSQTMLLAEGFGELSEAQQEQMELEQAGSKGLLDFERAITQIRNTIFGTLLDTDVFQNLSEAFGGLTETFGTPEFQEGLKTALSGVTTVMSGFASLFGDFTKKLESGMNFSDALSEAFDNNKEEIKKGLQSILEQLSPVFDAVANVAVSVLGSLAKTALSKFWDEIIVAGIGAVAGGVAIKALMAKLPVMLATLLGGPITIALGALAAGIVAIFGWDAIKSFFENPIKSIKAMTKAIADFFTWERVSGMFSTAIDAIYFVPNQILKIFDIAPVSEQMSAGLDAILAIPRKIRELFPAAVEFFQPAVDLIQSVSERISELFAPVTEFFQPVTDMISSVAGMIQSIIEKIVNFFADIIDKIPGVGLAKDAFGAVKGFFGGSKEEAEEQNKQPNRYEQIKARQERRRAVMENNGVAPEVSEQDAARAKSQAGNVADQMDSGSTATTPDADTIDKTATSASQLDQALGSSTSTIYKTATSASRLDQALDSNSNTIDKALNSTTAFDRALASTGISLDSASTRLADISEKTAKLREVDADELSSYNREITRSLEAIKTQTGGGATITTRDGTETVVPPENNITSTEQIEKLNTTLQQLLETSKQGNKISDKSYRVTRENSNNMW